MKMGGRTRSTLDDLRVEARAGMLRAASAPAKQGVPGTAARGQLIRPLVAIAGSAGPEARTPAFWEGVLAVQLAHDASLLHDDVVDRAGVRRGEPTLAAEQGVGTALLTGDHLLTAAYRAAARTRSIEFVTLFARAVERTVAGEALQGRAAGQRVDRRLYEQIVLGKSGELLGCALAISATLEGREDMREVFELGRRIGLLYQMLDDLLDYCPATRTGKRPLGDYEQGRWTWVLDACPEVEFGRPGDEVLRLLHRVTPTGSAMTRSLARFHSTAEVLRMRARNRIPHPEVLEDMIAEWVQIATRAVRLESTLRSAGAADGAPRPVFQGPVAADAPTPAVVPDVPDGPRTSLAARASGADLIALLSARIPDPAAVDRYLAVHSRSFRFASRFFPGAEGARVARVYAYCRVTDDLVDRPEAEIETAVLLDQWAELSRYAYDGGSTGIPLLDLVMTEMSERAVPFEYAEDLIEGMRMDLRGERYAALVDLRRYTYRVASVVGLWLARSFGVNDPAVLQRAERMGHAMQLTNILRDVGEDRVRGRTYLPEQLLSRYGLAEADLDMMRATGRPTQAYARMTEALLGVAEEHYAAALEALPLLPASFARPVAVAAYVYRGIHDEIRKSGYDNLTRRAVTSPASKATLAARGLWNLRRASPTMLSGAGEREPARERSEAEELDEVMTADPE